VNVLSTIILDGFLFDTPSICPVFGSKEKGLKNIEKYLDYAHLQQVVESHAVAIVKDRESYLKAINEVLINPAIRLKEQKKFIELEMGMSLEGTSKRIVGTLFQLND
jgi:DNA integrity scanning protein DisA with diadenylate cyclase activity